MQLIQMLKGFNADGLDMDEAICLLSIARGMHKTYEEKAVEPPEWLNDAHSALDKEVSRRYRDSLERELKDIEAREEQLKTASEKREDLAAKKARITAALGKP